MNDDVARAKEPEDSEGTGGVVIPVAFDAGSGRHRGGAPVASTVGLVGADRDVQELHVSSFAPVEDGTVDDLVPELTRRQRRLVEVSAWTLADDLYDAVEELERSPEAAWRNISILSDFPPSTWTQPVSWWREQARCFEDLAAEAASNIGPDPRCIAEEMALSLILGRARAMATDRSDVRADVTAEHDSDDDWDGPLENLFHDHDVLTLFEDNGESHSGAVNLEPARWFSVFRDSEPRDPGRGFRR